MAITNAIPAIWSARVLAAFQASSVWAALVNDVSSELQGEGDRLNLTSLTTAPAVATYNVGTDMAAPAALTDAQVVLNLDKQYAWNFKIDDVDRVQMKPNLVDTHSQRQGQALAIQYDDDLRTAALAGIAAAKVVESVVETGRDSGTVAEQSTFRTATAAAVAEATEQADSAHWPREGRWAVMHPRTARRLGEYIIDQGYNIETQQADAQVRGRLGMLHGWALHVDPGMPTCGR